VFVNCILYVQMYVYTNVSLVSLLSRFRKACEFHQYMYMSFLNIEKEENDQNMQYLQRQLSFVACQSQSEIEIHTLIYIYLERERDSKTTSQI